LATLATEGEEGWPKYASGVQKKTRMGKSGWESLENPVKCGLDLITKNRSDSTKFCKKRGSSCQNRNTSFSGRQARESRRGPVKRKKYREGGRRFHRKLTFGGKNRSMFKETVHAASRNMGVGHIAKGK